MSPDTIVKLCLYDYGFADNVYRSFFCAIIQIVTDQPYKNISDGLVCLHNPGDLDIN